MAGNVACGDTRFSKHTCPVTPSITPSSFCQVEFPLSIQKKRMADDMQLTNSGRASNFIRVVMAPPDSATGGWRTAVILTCWTCSKASGVAWVKVSMWMPAPGSSRIKQPMSNHLDGYKETGVLAKKGWIVFIGIERNNRVGVSQLKKRKIVRQEMIKLSSFSTDYLFSYTLESPTIRNISPLVRPMTSQVVTWTLCLRQLFVASQGTSWSFSKFFWEIGRASCRERV